MIRSFGESRVVWHSNQRELIRPNVKKNTDHTGHRNDSRVNARIDRLRPSACTGGPDRRAAARDTCQAARSGQR